VIHLRVTKKAVIAGRASQVLAEINVPPRAKMSIALFAPMTSHPAVNVKMAGLVDIVKKVVRYHTAVHRLVTSSPVNVRPAKVVGLGNIVKTSVLTTVIGVLTQQRAKIVKLGFMGIFVKFPARLNVKIAIETVNVKHV
jgi:hypothetical protein